VLTALATSACVVSFDGYELGPTDGGSSGGIGGGDGGAPGGGASGAGSGGVSGSGTGATGGTLAGGAGGAGGVTGGGGSGGSPGGGGGTTGGAGGTSASGGTGGATGGTGGGTGGTTGGAGGTTGGSGGTSASGGAGGATGGSGGTSASGGTGGATGGTGGGTGGAPPTCPTVPGTATMVMVPGGASKDFCIDMTEVTQKEYNAWLATSPTTSGQPAACSTNSTYVPSCNWTPIPSPQKPVVCVDWCDAYAYCKGVGKRLCGKVGGGAVASTDLINANQSQWYYACSKHGAQLYPYGPVYSTTACVGLENSFIGTQNVGLLSTCNGGYSTLTDMSGNAAEWEDGCNGNSCPARGGHYNDGATNLRCDTVLMAPRMEQVNKRGFRCCAD